MCSATGSRNFQEEDCYARCTAQELRSGCYFNFSPTPVFTRSLLTSLTAAAWGNRLCFWTFASVLLHTGSFGQASNHNLSTCSGHASSEGSLTTHSKKATPSLLSLLYCQPLLLPAPELRCLLVVVPYDVLSYIKACISPLHTWTWTQHRECIIC